MDTMDTTVPVGVAEYCPTLIACRVRTCIALPFGPRRFAHNYSRDALLQIPSSLDARDCLPDSARRMIGYRDSPRKPADRARAFAFKGPARPPKADLKGRSRNQRSPSMRPRSRRASWSPGVPLPPSAAAHSRLSTPREAGPPSSSAGWFRASPWSIPTARAAYRMRWMRPTGPSDALDAGHRGPALSPAHKRPLRL